MHYCEKFLKKEVQKDLNSECGDEIKQILYDYFVKNLIRGVVRGLPEWYKDGRIALKKQRKEMRRLKRFLGGKRYVSFALMMLSSWILGDTQK